MFIENAYAADAPDAIPGTAANPAMPQPPGVAEAFAWNMGMVLVLVVLFYVLLIKPQQRRFQAHSQMLSGLKKGDKVVTGGGLIGMIDKIGDSDEVIVDLGNGIKVSALRSSIQGKDDPLLRKNVANDLQTAKAEQDDKKS